MTCPKACPKACPRACAGAQNRQKKLSKPQVLRSLKNLQQKAKNKQIKMSYHEEEERRKKKVGTRIR